MFRGPARIHKKLFNRIIDGVGEDVLVRQPAPRPVATSAVDKVLSTRPTVAITSYGPEQTVTAVVGSPDQVVTNVNWGPKIIQALGGLDQLDLILRVKLDDVLSNPDQPLGRTIFHTAKDVVYKGQVFSVTGVDRTGMAPLDAYIVWVGLKKTREA